MEVGQHSPYPKTQQRHRQENLIQAHIPPLSNCKDIGEEPSSLHNSKHTKQTHATRVQNTTLYSDGTHTLNNTVAKGFHQMAPPELTITVALNMSKAFNTINIHTLIRKLLQTNIKTHSLSLSQTTSRDAKLTQHIEITHPNNSNLKLAFHKVASFHPHYLTCTPQTYHHPVHRFRS